MKKLILLAIFSLVYASISYAEFNSNYFDEFTDEGICLWLHQSPTNPSYKEQAEKRGLSCSKGSLIGKTNGSVQDDVEIAYQKISDVKESISLEDQCSEIVKKRVVGE